MLCFHGEPSWSYLYRHMLEDLVASGHRVVCPDLVGFGRSDKPTDQDWYTYDRHVESVSAHLAELDLDDVTVVVQDWGGPIGLRWATENADRVGRLVILNTGLFTGRVSKGFMAWRDFAERTPDLPIGRIIEGATATELSPQVVAAYEAPFPNPESKAGAQRFPLLVPLSESDPGAAEMAAVRERLAQLGEAGPGRLLRRRSGLPFPARGRAVHRADPQGRRAGPDRRRRPFPAGGSRRRDRRGDAGGVRSARRSESRGGYWPRPWTCEDGGPRRWGSAEGQPGLGIEPGERPRPRRGSRCLRHRPADPPRAGRALRIAP